MAAYQRAYRARRKAANPSYEKEYNLRFRQKHPERYLYHSAKGRAKQDGLDFDIDIEDIVIPEICPVLKTRLVVQAGGGKQWNSPSLDRIDSSKGYVKGNIQVISWRANHLKSDGTSKEFKMLSDFLNDKS